MARKPEEAAGDRPWIEDTAAFNRWLCFTRLRAAAAVAVFFPLLHWLGLARLEPGPILAVTAGLAVFSAFGLGARVRTETSRAFLWLQMVVDLLAITLGIGLGTEGAVALLARPIYALIVVPASLVSVPMGLAVATLATLGHGVLLAIERGATSETFLSFDFLAPTFLFYLIAQQSFFYGGHLRRKNAALAALAERLEESQRRLAAEGRLAAELVELARTLSARLDDPEPLSAAIRTIRDRLWADWGAIFAVDGDTGFRLLGSTDAEVSAGGVDRVALPIASWPALERLRVERALVLGAGEGAFIPASLTRGRGLASVLLAALYRDAAMVGFIVVGYGTPLDGAGAWATSLLAGVAEHATVVLQNARLLEEVRAASALKSEFVGAVSHELRSPLNVILGYLEMVLDGALGPLTAEQTEALRRTETQAAAFLEMIDALLDVNRFEAGRLELERSQVSLEAVLASVCGQLGRTARRPGVALRLEIDPHLPRVETDAGKLKTIVRNLVHNALKFTEVGHVAVGASLVAPGEVAITVEDTGCGIPPEALAYVFEMFRQVPGTRGGGVGLGLHIVRRLAEAIGATLSVTSGVGVGSRFTLTLPRLAPARDDLSRPAPAAEWS